MLMRAGYRRAMSQPDSHEQRPWTAPQPVAHRAPDPNRNPQWATDDSAYATCLVYAAIALSIVGAIVGGVLWFFWEAIRLLLGW
jgi:hypothetical protein